MTDLEIILRGLLEGTSLTIHRTYDYPSALESYNIGHDLILLGVDFIGGDYISITPYRERERYVAEIIDLEDMIWVDKIKGLIAVYDTEYD